MKNILKCAGVIILVLLLQSLSPAFQNEKESGAKALFYDPETGTALRPSEKRRTPNTGRIRVKRAQANRAKYVGLHYWIELQGIGNVADDHIFHTGDRIRLHIRSNMDGYLSLWSLDSFGQGRRLLPTSDQASSASYVDADYEYVTPGVIKFSPPVEDERLLVFFSRSEVDLPIPMANRADSNVIAKSQNLAGSKALVFETEHKNMAEVGSYIVNKNGGVVVKEIRLKHRSPNKN